MTATYRIEPISPSDDRTIAPYSDAVGIGDLLSLSGRFMPGMRPHRDGGSSSGTTSRRASPNGASTTS